MPLSTLRTFGLLPLSLLACAVIHAEATNTRAASFAKLTSGLKHRRHVVGTHSQAHIKVHRLAGMNTELHVTGTEKKTMVEIGSFDTSAASRDNLFVQVDRKRRGNQTRHAFHHGSKTMSHTAKSSPAAGSHMMLINNSDQIDPLSFFQEGSTKQAEHDGEKSNAAPIAKTTSFSEASSPSFLEDASEAALETLGATLGSSAKSSEEEEPTVSSVGFAVAALSEQTVSAPKRIMRTERMMRNQESSGQVTAEANKNSFMSWVKGMVAVGAGAEAGESNAADSLGASEDEANYSAESEGSWLLACLVGLVLFSCMLVVVLRAMPWLFYASGRVPSLERLIKEAGVAADAGTAAASVHEPAAPVVPAFQAVVNSAREVEEASLQRAAVGGVRELLSAVVSMSAETSVAELPLKGCGKFSQSLTRSSLRAQVECIDPSAEDILAKFEDAEEHAGYDCVLTRPLSFSQVIRLQATVMQPSSSDLLAPLALRMCVLYQVTVSRRLHAGMLPAPLAFSSMNTSFQVAPCERPGLRVNVAGAAVMLFDTVAGHFNYQGPFASAPGHLQDYVLTHRSAVPGCQWQTSAALRMDDTPLEFEECALLVGSKVTLVGELSRDSGGNVVLKPAYLGLPELSGAPRVLVSDDPQLQE